MALKKTQDYRGVPITDAYCRVENLCPHSGTMASYTYDAEGQVTGETTEITYHLSFSVVFSSAQGEREIYRERKNCEYDLSGANAWIQAYAYLKTLPEFSGAVDV